MNLQSLHDQAVGFHRSGDLAQAESLYLQLIQVEPGNQAVLHLLGVLRFQQGRHLEALRLIESALKISPTAVAALANYGNVQKALGRLGEALASYEQALIIEPGNPVVLNNRGVVLFHLHRFEDALISYNEALAIKPDYAEVLNNRGNTLFALNRFQDALASYDQALEIRPDYAQAHSNRGNALLELKRPEEALTSYDSALAIKPALEETLNNRGSALREMKRYEEALASYNKALAIGPDNAEVLNNRANTLRDLNRTAEALASYDRAIAARPGYAQAHHNRGVALWEIKRFEQALVSYDQALAINPQYVEALNDRGILLRDMTRIDEALASYDKALSVDPGFVRALSNRSVLLWSDKRQYEPAMRDLEKVVAIDTNFDYARGDLLHLRMYGADWRNFDGQKAIIDHSVRAGKRIVNPFAYLAISESPADLQACASIYTRHLYPKNPTRCVHPPRGVNRRIRVGYLSGEFRDQATAHLAVGLYEHHDKRKFEIIALDNGRADKSPVRKRLEAAFAEFIDISKLSDAEAAEKIRERQIDILVNLNGYFGSFRMGVFALRPAPVQVNYLGFPGTLGAGYIDYILADRIVIPENEQQFYTEKIVYLPGSYQVNDSRRPIGQRMPVRAENGLPEGAFVYCSFNQGYKLTPEMFTVWMRILKETEGSILWIWESNKKFAANLRREAECLGVARERLVFAPSIPVEMHLARLRLADLFLDSLPCNAHTTASDALWAGLPLITCRGNSFSGRVASSLLSAMNLLELVTENLEDYEILAVRLARNPALLKAVRDKLALNRLNSSLFNTDTMRRNIESAYAKMWEIWRQGEYPYGFSVGTADPKSPDGLPASF